jgi:hypothetical protein
MKPFLLGSPHSKAQSQQVDVLLGRMLFSMASHWLTVINLLVSAIFEPAPSGLR